MHDSPVPAAPAALEPVRAFVNTWDIEAAEDAIATPAALGRWLMSAELVDGAVRATAADLAHAAAVREALRAALAANHDGGPVPAGAMAVVNDAAERAGLALSMTPEAGWVARPRASGVDGAIGALLVIVIDAMTDGSWRRLKVCVNDTCQWAFYDHSRARSGKWCSMQVCGNRAKQQAWRARHDPSA